MPISSPWVGLFVSDYTVTESHDIHCFSPQSFHMLVVDPARVGFGVHPEIQDDHARPRKCLTGIIFLHY